MADPLRVDVPSAELGDALIRRLHAFPTELHRENGRVQVSVELVGSPEQAIVAVLDGVDAWLVDHGLEGADVHLDGRVYTMMPRPAG